MDIQQKSSILCVLTISILIHFSPIRVKALGTDQKFPLAQVIDTIKCTKDTKQSYALYLPSTYDKSKIWPVIFVFEPGARGKMPVDSFKLGAEKYGYIVAASNNSKNGPWDNSFTDAESMFNDVASRFHLDAKRMYLAGFSGGARLATALAGMANQFAGVIACGAGFPNIPEYDPPKNAPFVYLGIIGKTDMNYLEVDDLETAFPKLNLTGCVRLFDGAHRWPSPQVLANAVEWIELIAMARRNIPVNKVFIDQQINAVKNRIDLAEKNGDWIEACRSLQELILTFKPLLDVSGFEEHLQKIRESKNYKEAEKKQKEIAEQEYMVRLKHNKAISEVILQGVKADSVEQWLRTEIRYWHQRCDTKDNDYKNMAERHVNNLSFHFIDKGSECAELKNYRVAIKLFKLWTYSEPTNKRAYLNLANLYLSVGEDNNAIKEIEKAMSFGLSLEILKRYPAFNKLESNKKFLKLLSIYSK